MSQYELQWRPRPGQVLLYIDFSEVKSRSISETLSIVEQLGYTPQLRYLERTEPQRLELYALLKDEQLDPTQPGFNAYMSDEWERLAEALAPDYNAVRNPHGLARKQAEIAA